MEKIFRLTLVVNDKIVCVEELKYSLSEEEYSSPLFIFSLLRREDEFLTKHCRVVLEENKQVKKDFNIKEE